MKKSSCRFGGSEESPVMARASGENVSTVPEWKTVEGGAGANCGWICEFFFCS